MKQSTTRIFTKDKEVWSAWCKASGLSSAELIHKIITVGNLEARKLMYSKLPVRNNYKKPLRGCKIKKYKKSIQK